MKSPIRASFGIKGFIGMLILSRSQINVRESSVWWGPPWGWGEVHPLGCCCGPLKVSQFPPFPSRGVILWGHSPLNASTFIKLAKLNWLAAIMTSPIWKSRLTTSLEVILGLKTLDPLAWEMVSLNLCTGNLGKGGKKLFSAKYITWIKKLHKVVK